MSRYIRPLGAATTVGFSVVPEMAEISNYKVKAEYSSSRFLGCYRLVPTFKLPQSLLPRPGKSKPLSRDERADTNTANQSVQVQVVPTLVVRVSDS